MWCGIIPREGPGGLPGLLLPPSPPPQEDTGRGSPWRVRAEGSWTVAGLVAAGAKASGAPPGGWARLGPQEITIITK